jgi:membrane protease YdiL (CAAX protease family)
MRRLARHPIAWFLAITFATTWAAWLILAVSGITVGVGLSALYLVGLVGPLVGAVVATTITDGSSGLRDLLARMIRIRVGLRWWGVAIGIPLAVAGAVYVFHVAYSMFLLAPTELPSRTGLGQFTGFPITSAIVMWLLLVVVNGFGEETGWRGFLLPRLQRRWSPLASSLIVAGVWGTWHVPAFLINDNYRSMPVAMIPMFFVGLACGSILLTWLYNQGRQSILLVAVWHGTFNLVSGTVAARGALASVESMVVIAIAIIVVVRELVAVQRERSGRLVRHVMAPSPA